MKRSFLMLILVCVTVACAPRGFSPPPEPYEEFAHKHKRVTVDEIKSSMIDCGYLPEWGYAGQPEDDYQKRMNGKVIRLECMFQKGFYFKDGWGGYCSEPEYRPKLPACLNAPIRPRQGYYGQ